MNRNKKLLLISLLYFAEGFPFGIIEQTLPTYFCIHGWSVVHLGLFSLVALPYALKFLWAPAVDFIGNRQYWVAAAQFLMAALLGLLTLLNPAEPSVWLWVCIGCLAIMSATQDIAIDAYSIELLNTSEMGIANGFRQAAYRVALVLSGGMFVALGGWIGWGVSYALAAFVLVACGIMSLSLPQVETQHRKFSFSAIAEPFKDLCSRPGLVSVALFILFYKLGDLAMGPMVRPFWIERGLSTTEIGLITGTLGIAAAIAGGLAGGLFTSRYGIFNGLWFLGLGQTGSHLIYVWVAACPYTGQWGVYLASFAESFCSGLGTAAFLAFLMSICNKEYSATQYALLSALFRVTGIIAGTLSGWLTDGLGYANYFALAFLLPLPSFLFLFKARSWIPDTEAGKVEIPAAKVYAVSPPKEELASRRPEPKKPGICEEDVVVMNADKDMDEPRVRPPLGP